ncbi:kinase-like domain-containing protein [Thelephora terrestris]|uniref:Kinase-like domain-containing protein n=1 Tax=Thelephora terrestris TaxID=56493 RepID=A0A9P6LAA0_9AGAM|nr:kinase-like domain-containing protein [Thelephora terrestris]
MGVDFNGLWLKARTTEDEAESVRTLAEILSSKDGRMFILNLGSSDAEPCIELMDNSLTGHKLCTRDKTTFFGCLRKLAGRHARLPNSMVIRDEISFSESMNPYISCGLTDLKLGQYKGCTVAVKRMRETMADGLEKIRKRFCKEVVLWNFMSHPNVSKLVGVLEGVAEGRFVTVSEWMPRGNIIEYTRRNATNRLELLRGAGQGLQYLHRAAVVHGNLKGANILMTNDSPPKPCLADFAFVNTALDPRNPTGDLPVLTLEGSWMTFMAPELFAYYEFGLENSVLTNEGDIYAFGLVILQVLTGELPFHNIKPLELAHHVLRGVRPNKPTNAEDIGISDRLWELMQRCWDGDKTQRPLIKEVVEVVGNAAANWHIVMPPGGTEQQEDSVLWEDSDRPRNCV